MEDLLLVQMIGVALFVLLIILFLFPFLLSKRYGHSFILLKSARRQGECIKLKIVAEGDFSLLGAKPTGNEDEYLLLLESGEVKILGNILELTCSHCEIVSLELRCRSLEYLRCDNNQIHELDLVQIRNLEYLNCHSNQLSRLSLPSGKRLVYLNCASNQLTDLSVYSYPNLVELHCEGNKLRALNLSKNAALEVLICFNNDLSSVDLSLNAKLNALLSSEEGL